MTAPGGTPGLPTGSVLKLENLESRLQDLTSTAMKGRALDWFPSLVGNTTGGDPGGLGPFGFLTDLWARWNSTIANADPDAVKSVEDLGPLFIEFVENLPVIGQFVTLVEAILGTYTGSDEFLLQIQAIFAPLRALLSLITNFDGIPTVEQLTEGFGALLAIPGQLIQAVIDWLMQGVTGGSGTGNPGYLIQAAIQRLVEAAQAASNSAAEAWTLAAQALAAIDAAVHGVAEPIYTDSAAAIAAGATAVASLVGTAVNAEAQAIGWVLGFVNAVTGQSNTTATVSQASAQAAALAEQQAAAAIAIARQQSTADGAANGGVFSSDDFERVSTTDLNGSLSGAWATTTTLISGTTPGFYAIPDGHSASLQRGTNDAHQLTVHRRTLPADAKTQTLYQKVGVILASFIGDGPAFGLGIPRTRVRMRLSDDEKQEVFCNVGVDGFAQFGYRNGSFVDNMVGSPVYIGGASPGTAFYGLAGVGALRQFELVKGGDGGSVVATWNDSGALSAAVQGTNNGWGWGGEAYSGGGVPQQAPPDIGIVTIADNTPVAVRGNQFRSYRSSGSSVTINAGSAFPGGLFDAVDAQSVRCPFNTSAGTFTVPVGLSGYWIFDVGIQSSALPGGSKWMPVLYVNGSVRQIGSEYFLAGSTRIREQFGLNLQEGDVVAPGMASGVSAAFATGDASGTLTWFSGVLASGAAA